MLRRPRPALLSPDTAENTPGAGGWLLAARAEIAWVMGSTISQLRNTFLRVEDFCLDSWSQGGVERYWAQ
jgi:hypothetical protein